MRVLIGCEFSGVVRRAFRERGHDAWSCDLLPAEDGSEFHIQADIFGPEMCYWSLQKGWYFHGWDLGIFHPPCTFILNSGCKHLYKNGKRFLPDGTENPRNPERWRKMEEGARFFRDCLHASIDRVACENPIMVGYAKEIVGCDFTQKIQPWEFGHTESKATCLWLRNLPPLKPTNNVYEEMMKLPKNKRERIHFMSPGMDRGHERSRSYTGIAEAMAEQWGSLK